MYGFSSTLSLPDALYLQMYFVMDSKFHEGTAVNLGNNRATGSSEELLGECIQSLSSKAIPITSQNEPSHFASHEKAVWICEFDQIHLWSTVNRN